MHRRNPRAFSLVELLVVIGIIALLIAVLMPVMASARKSAMRVKCLSNMRQLALAQCAYASTNRDALVIAGDGLETQGSWLGLLQPYTRVVLARRCPMDGSRFFDDPFDATTNPPTYRTTSYAINNFVSPTHTPNGAKRYEKLTQIRSSSRIIQFAELAEQGPYAVADHVHVQQFFNSLIPQAVVSLASEQMPIGRHGGRVKNFNGVLNYTFLDGHAEALPFRDVYQNKTINLFDPSLNH
ncbi:MAG TPA: type II secretion system protein [Tepidisphaeraceae bacterium]|nr:type II secretion system protein [Tepidisphaeraceae bacterium]